MTWFKKKKLEEGEIKFSLSKNVPIVTGKINGKGIKLLIDTGASISILHKDILEKIDIQAGSQLQYGMRGIGGDSGELYNINKSTHIEFKNHSLKIHFKTTSMKSVFLKLGVVGIIGTDFLKRHDCVIDYKNKILKCS